MSVNQTVQGTAGQCVMVSLQKYKLCLQNCFSQTNCWVKHKPNQMMASNIQEINKEVFLFAFIYIKNTLFKSLKKKIITSMVQF